MVSINNQSANAAAIDSHRQRHPALMTTSRASRRCPVGIHHLDLSASLFRFVNDDGNELRPTGVMNTFRQMMVLDHPFDIQIFEFDDTIFLGKFVCLFEMMISTLPSHVLMPLGQQANGFLSSPAPSFAARNSSLRCLQFALCLTMILRIRNLIVIRQMGKSLEAHINPNRYIRSKNNSFLFNLLDLKSGHFCFYRQAAPPRPRGQALGHTLAREDAGAPLRRRPCFQKCPDNRDHTYSFPQLLR
jgi:hypothetical protein